MTNQTYFRRGFGLKKEIADELTTDYYSQLVEVMRDAGNELVVGDMTFRLATEFGFCYGVDRAVEYAYETRRKFPERRIFLVGEIIHNPHVNRRIEDMRIEILKPQDGSGSMFAAVTSHDVVILPAFGVTVEDFAELQNIGCVLVDTTCGSVLNVWKRVQKYAKDGFTAVVHGKFFHEETKATVSQVTKFERGRYIIVRDMKEAELVCGFIEGKVESKEITERFSQAVSPGFDPARDLQHVGVANQTTMLSSESLAIGRRFREAIVARFGEPEVGERFRTFDTICSATQDRQDAVLELIEQPLDAMLVIGGYNSSNTNHLAKLCAKRVMTFHISDASCIEPGTRTISHKKIGTTKDVIEERWPDEVNVVGVTAGASTPNNKIGEAIERIIELKGLTAPA